MKTKKLIQFLPVLLLAFIFTSCLEETRKEAFDVMVDAYTVKRVIDNEPEFAQAFIAYSNQPMLGATVSKSDNSGPVIQLAQNPSSVFIYMKDPNAYDFRPGIPENAEYKFTVTSESGNAIEKFDELKPKNLAIPQIDSLTIDDAEKLLSFEWNKVNGADGYIVKVLDLNGKTIFTSEGLPEDAHGYYLSLLTGNWIDSINFGDDYILELHAFAYEDSALESNNIYNVEEISIAQFRFTWE